MIRVVSRTYLAVFNPNQVIFQKLRRYMIFRPIHKLYRVVYYAHSLFTNMVLIIYWLAGEVNCHVASWFYRTSVGIEDKARANISLEGVKVVDYAASSRLAHPTAFPPAPPPEMINGCLDCALVELQISVQNFQQNFF